MLLAVSMLMNVMAFPALADGGISGGQFGEAASGNEASASDAERESDVVLPEETKAEEPENPRIRPKIKFQKAGRRG